MIAVLFDWAVNSPAADLPATGRGFLRQRRLSFEATAGAGLVRRDDTAPAAVVTTFRNLASRGTVMTSVRHVGKVALENCSDE